MQIVDLMDHMQTPKHVAAVQALSISGQPAEEDSNHSIGIPTVAQLILSQQVLSVPTSAQGSEYERRNALAGLGDKLNYPHAHGGKTQHCRNVRAMAVTLFDKDTEDLQATVKCTREGYLATAWAEDVTNDLKLTRLKIVTRGFEVKTRVVDVSVATEKLALRKKEQAEASVHSFCGSRPELRSALQQSVQAWCTDGEPAELAAGLLCRQAVFPQLKIVWRCMAHSAQKGLEKAMLSDDRVQGLVKSLVTLPAAESPSGPGYGSLARALSNSPKLRGKFKETERRQLDSVAELQRLGLHVVICSPMQQVILMSRCGHRQTRKACACPSKNNLKHHAFDACHSCQSAWTLTM